MSLPPVVSDPERCEMHPEPKTYGRVHDWVIIPDCSLPPFRVCRYCGGRKP